MIKVMVTATTGANLYSMLRRDLDAKKLSSFRKVKVKGGLKVKHVAHPGTISLSNSHGILIAKIVCKAPGRDWQILRDLVGRLADRYRNRISGLSVQFG